VNVLGLGVLVVEIGQLLRGRRKAFVPALDNVVAQRLRLTTMAQMPSVRKPLQKA